MWCCSAVCVCVCARHPFFILNKQYKYLIWYKLQLAYAHLYVSECWVCVCVMPGYINRLVCCALCVCKRVFYVVFIRHSHDMFCGSRGNRAQKSLHTIQAEKATLGGHERAEHDKQISALVNSFVTFTCTHAQCTRTLIVINKFNNSIVMNPILLSHWNGYMHENSIHDRNPTHK